MPDAGDRLLHYRLVEQIGEGGMGVVWKAADETLEREVAIKLLPPALAADATYLARFEREAKLLAALSHPNIAQVYGLHESEGTRFLAMELVPGTDLARRLARGPLSVEETIEVGLQVTAALESAHLRGVVHRDLKPANVMLTPEGRVLVLDFGLARQGGAEADAADATRSPTLTLSATLAGALLGTAAYMSPEQARGQPADKRSDLWALGCLLYECLTAESAFAGETISDTLAAVLRGEPDWSKLPPATPPRLRELIGRCLAKEPDRRQRDAGDAGLDLRAALETAPETGGTTPGGGGVGWKIAAAAALAALAVGALVGRLVDGGSASPSRVVRASLHLPEGFRPVTARISPDGRFVGVAAESTVGGPAGHRERRLFVRELAADDGFVSFAEGLAGWWFRFSPDSRRLALTQHAPDATQGAVLALAPVDASSPPLAIAPWEDGWLEDMVWLSDDELATVSFEPPRLVRIPLDGSPRPPPLEVRLTSATERFFVHSLAPDGAILGTVEDWTGGYHEDAARLDPRTGVVTTLVDRASEPAYIAPGMLGFTRRDQLLVAPYDHRTGTVTGVPEVAATGLRSPMTTAAAGLFSVSARGDLVFIEGGLTGLHRRLVWLEPDGTRTPFGSFSAPIVENELDDSQDGSVIAFVRVGPTGLYEIWASEVDDPAPRPVLARRGQDCISPVVSPTGDRIAALCFGERRGYALYLAEFPSIDTQGRLLVDSGGDERLTPRSWTPDGGRLLVRRSVAGVSSLEILDVGDGGEAGAEPRPVPGLDGDIGFAMVSPDGGLIGFSRWDGAAWSLEIAPWDGERAGPSRPAARSAVSFFDWTGVARDGLDQVAVVAAKGGPKLLYVDPRGRVVATEESTALTDTGGDVLSIAALSDGRVLAVESSPEELRQQPLRLVTDWASTLR